MKQIASALVKAQKEFGPALKTHTNPAFRSKYADLSACVEAVVDALNNNGIFLMQATHDDQTGVTVETIFIHESGEQVSAGRLHVPATKQDAQGYGSAATYARRYSLMAACGIAPEDDDGAAASRGKPAVIPATFKSSPTMGVLETMPVEERDYLRDLALEIIALVAQGKDADAWRKVESEHMDDAQKTALWACLDSKTRAAIKRAGQALKEAA